MDWGKRWLVDFNVGKTELVLFDWSNNSDSIDMKMDGSVLEERSSVSLLCISINLPYAHIWNTVVTSGLVTLVATWNC